MTTTSKTAALGLRFHPAAYEFVDAALRRAQKRTGRRARIARDLDEHSAHISGQELLEGARQLALEKFGLMTTTVFRHWGVRSTEDFGRIVFELVERGIMRKTDRDQLSDFVDVFDFDEEFDRQYRIDVSKAFQD